MRQINVFLADDHAVLRAGLKALLETEPDMTVVGEASDGFDCVEQVVEIRPDVILLDINMPGCNGVEALKKLRVLLPESRVLMLTMHDDGGYLRQVLSAGAAGFVLKQAASEELLAAIRAVIDGGVYLHPQHTALLLDEDGRRKAETGRPADVKTRRYDTLSEREAQVFKLVALGHRNQEIADMIFLSPRTVETYKARLMQKLGVESRAALVRYALDVGLLDDEGSDQNR